MSALGKSPIAQLDTSTDELYALVWDTLEECYGVEQANALYQQVRFQLRDGEAVSTALILRLCQDYTSD